jgi:hypothetical protein
MNEGELDVFDEEEDEVDDEEDDEAGDGFCVGVGNRLAAAFESMS